MAPGSKDSPELPVRRGQPRPHLQGYSPSAPPGLAPNRSGRPRRPGCVPVWSWRVRLPCLCMLHFGKREVERRTFIRCPFAPDLPAMAVDDALNGGQSNPGAFKLFRQMQALKNAEQLVHISHVKACAVVTYEDFD